MGVVNVKTAAEIEGDRIDRLKSEVRSDRNRLLRDSDYLVMPDYPQKPAGIEEYRQALRDITDQSGFPESVEWPER